jgi:hypothetical protein
LPTGLWLLLQLPSAAQTRILRRSAGTAMFTAAIAARALVQQLAAASLAGVNPIMRIIVLMLAVLILMSSVLHRTRCAASNRMDPPFPV